MIIRTLILALGVAVVACDGAETRAVEGVGMAGVTGEGGLVNPEDDPLANGDISPPNTPTSPVSISWIDSEGAQEALAFSITNLGHQAFVVATEMKFIGLGSTFSMDFGQIDLAQGESTELSVSAADFPIQVLSGACQAIVSVNKLPAVKGERAEPPVLSEVRFYRHLDGYQSLLSMTEAELIADNGGVLLETGLSVDFGGKLQAGSIGRKRDALGSFTEVSGLSEHLVQRDDHGNIISVVMGHRIGISDDEPGAELEAMEVEDEP